MNTRPNAAITRTRPKLKYLHSVIPIDLTGKNAIVTGGTRGIGRAIAVLLAKAGANVTTLSRSPDTSPYSGDAETAGRISYRPLDITDSAAVSRTIAEVDAATPIDIAVANAAVLAPGAAIDTDDRLWRWHMSTNVDGTFYMVRESLRAMVTGRRSGKVIVVGSCSGIIGNGGFAAYCASKAVWVNLVRQLALDYAKHGINVNSILPGYTKTEMTDVYTPEAKAAAAELVPLKRWAEPEEIGNVALFLASPLSDYMHGANLVVDGGLVCGVSELETL